jgi:hypothetical protein
MEAAILMKRDDMLGLENGRDRKVWIKEWNDITFFTNK